MMISKKLHPAIVGTFVLSAAVLAVASVIVFGKGAFLEHKYQCVLYFDESIDGLDVGAPVDFMGVRIGNIASIGLVVDGRSGNSFRRPVTISLDGSRITFTADEEDDSGMEEWLEGLIQKNGLRAQLATQSLLTGKLKIQLAFHPTSALHRKNITGSLVEIPTIPSTQASFKKSLEELQIDALMTDVREAVSGINKLVNNPEAGALLTNLNATLVRLDSTLAEANRFLTNSGGLLKDVAQDTKPLLQKASVSMDTLDTTLTNASRFMATLEAKTVPVLESLDETTKRVNIMLDDQSPIHMTTLEALEELQRSLRSFANLTDYLQQHPEALIRGKK